MEKLTLTAAEAAEALQISKPSFYELCKRPDFPVIRIGRKVLVSRDRLREWVNSKGAEAG